MTNTNASTPAARRLSGAAPLPADNASTPTPQPRPAKLEKIAAAASRMAVSVAQVYREAKAGRLTIIKLGPRASALESMQVDAWIAARISEATHGSACRQGGAR